MSNNLPKSWGDVAKWAAGSMAVGAVAAIAVGFYGLNWHREPTVNTKVQAAVQQALLPYCAQEFLAVEGAREEFQSAEGWRRANTVQKFLPEMGPADQRVSLGDWTFRNRCVSLIQEAIEQEEAQQQQQVQGEHEHPT